MELDDPLFFGLLSTLSLAAGGFWAWVLVTPLPEPALVDEAAVALVRDLPVPRIDIAMMSALAEPEVEATVVRPSRPAPAARPLDPAPQVAEPGRSGSLLVAQLGHLGPGGTALQTVLGMDDIDILQSALDGVTGARTVSLDGGMKAGAARGSDLGVELMTSGRGGLVVGTGATAAPRVRAKVETMAAQTESVSGGDASVIAGTVRASRGRIESCLEQSLKRDPGLSGRVSAAWTIRAGRVVEPRLVDNTTGDADLGACVVRAVRGFSFPKTLDAEVAELPWVVSAR
ncbi:MAG: AgmX/PglI C-terminal domain-containing protein [Pseudomonadota bacterium]|nr:AgmX/PglI C-terminal domain-containing protein [Pseudomonadota bacterium]